MGLLKWLKRETDSNNHSKNLDLHLQWPKRNINSSSSNDSYRTALSKFYHWRLGKDVKNVNASELHLTMEKHVKNKKNTSQMIYEDIFLYDKKVNDFKQSTGIDNKHEDNQCYLDKINYRTDSLKTEECDDKKEHIYSVPYLPYSTTYQQLNSTKYASSANQDLNLHNEVKVLQNSFNYTRGNVMITDLDKSQDNAPLSEENLKNSRQPNNDVCLLKYFSELMVFVLNEKKINKHKAKINIANGYIQHGKIASMDMCFMNVKNSFYFGLYKNYATLSKLRHPNIILLMGVLVSTNFVLEALIIEPVTCSLYERIHFKKNKIPITICHQYILQITNAVQFLHAKEIIHTNICSENIIITSNNKTIKLGGFELCIENKFLQYSNATNDAIYDLDLPLQTEYRKLHTKYNYQAPEFLSYSQMYIKPTIQSDIYGICLTLWEMLNCVVPYEKFTCDELIKCFLTSKSQFLPIQEKARLHPFKLILENGLKTHTSLRIPSIHVLKNELQLINLKPIEKQKQTTAVNPKNFIKNEHYNVNKIPKSVPKDVAYDFDEQIKSLRIHHINKTSQHTHTHTEQNNSTVYHNVYKSKNCNKSLLKHQFATLSSNKKYNINVLIKCSNDT